MNINRVIHILLIVLVSFVCLFTGCKSTKIQEDDLLEDYCMKIENAFIRQIELSINNSGIKQFYIPNTLIYRYSSESCSSCILNDLSHLRRIKDSIAKVKIKVLPSFLENRNNLIRLNMELKGFDFQNISDDHDLPKDSLTGMRTRYFVYFGNSKDECYVYFPEKTIPSITNKYLDWVVKKMCKNSDLLVN